MFINYKDTILTYLKGLETEDINTDLLRFNLKIFNSDTQEFEYVKETIYVNPEEPPMEGPNPEEFTFEELKNYLNSNTLLISNDVLINVLTVERSLDNNTAIKILEESKKNLVIETVNGIKKFVIDSLFTGCHSFTTKSYPYSVNLSYNTLSPIDVENILTEFTELGYNVKSFIKEAESSNCHRDFATNNYFNNANKIVRDVLGDIRDFSEVYFTIEVNV